MIRTILWDIDGTLMDFQQAERLALQSSFQHFGLGFCSQEQLARYSEINRQHWQVLEKGILTKAQLLPLRFQIFFAAEGIPFHRYSAFNDYYQIQLGEHIFFIDDSYYLVKELQGRVKQYAVTNGTKVAQDRKLHNAGLHQIFDGVFISEDVGAEKPSPVFFQRVLDAIAPCAKEDILLVGDSLSSDIQGANWAGIPCCWFNPQGQPLPDDLRIDYEIRSLAEVKEILAAQTAAL